MGGHESLRPYVQNADEAYGLLQMAHERQARELVAWKVVVVVAIATGLIATGPLANTGWCIAAMAAMRWALLAMDYVGRGWFMHRLSLRDLMAPPEGVDWGFLAALLDCIPREGAGAAQEAPPAAPPPSVH